jgi:predicted anti-sigma-YlaC factor YlaD
VGFSWRRGARCERWAKAISLRLDGEASELELAGLDKHLHACPRCRELAAELDAFTLFLRTAPLEQPVRPVVVTSPAAARRRVVRRSAALVLVTGSLGAALLGVVVSSDSTVTHPSSALGFRDLGEQRQYVRAELIRLEPEDVREAEAAPKFAGHGLL